MIKKSGNYNREKTASSINDVQVDIHLYMSEVISVSLNTKLSSKWIKDVNLRSKHLILLEENRKHSSMYGKDVLKRTPTAWEINSRTDKWDDIKLQCKWNNWMKWWAAELENGY